MKAIDIEILQKSLILKWVKRLLVGNESWKVIPCDVLNSFGAHFAILNWNINFNGIQNKEKIKILPDFYKLLIQTTLDAKDKEHELSRTQIIWNNNLIRFKGNMLYHERWIRAGLLHVYQLYDNNNHFITYDVTKDIVGYSANFFFEYYALKNALMNKKINDDSLSLKINRMHITEIGSFYGRLSNQHIIVPSAQKFWEKRFRISLNWKVIWTLSVFCCGEARLQTLQWKILHNIYPTSILLHKIGVRENSSCNMCNMGLVDSIEHFFAICGSVRPLWNNIKQFCYRKYIVEIDFTEENILFGLCNQRVPDKIQKCINHIILVAKLSISQYKYGKHANLISLFKKNCTLRKIVYDYL